MNCTHTHKAEKRSILYNIKLNQMNFLRFRMKFHKMLVLMNVKLWDHNTDRKTSHILSCLWNQHYCICKKKHPQARIFRAYFISTPLKFSCFIHSVFIYAVIQLFSYNINVNYMDISLTRLKRKINVNLCEYFENTVWKNCCILYESITKVNCPRNIFKKKRYLKK